LSKARLIFSTGSLWLTDTAYSFELAAEAGFDGIEIMCDQRFTTRNPDYLLSLAERYQLPILAVHTPSVTMYPVGARTAPSWGVSPPLCSWRNKLALKLWWCISP
jgi:sugar phosphate isomerase/epimerase